MGSYSPLFSIEVRHSFFAGGLCRDLDFFRTPQTDRVIQNAGLLIKDTKHGVRVFYDANTTDSLNLYSGGQDDPLILGFKVFSRDPLFANYTEAEINKRDSILYFDNLNEEIEDTGKLRLHHQEFVSDADSEKVDSPQLDNILGIKDRLVSPIFVINIRIPVGEGSLFDDQSKVISKDYYINFSGRQTIWKYCLMGEMAREDLFIADLDNETEFEFTGEETVGESRTALAFKSTTTVPIRERSDRRFQLRDKGSGNGRVVIRRLPVASASQISKEMIDGEEALVSEMLINC